MMALLAVATSKAAADDRVACCLEDGTAIQTTFNECLAMGGAPLSPQFDPVDVCARACCLPSDGSCVVTEAWKCVYLLGGIPRGLTCEAQPCPTGPDPNQGACCLRTTGTCYIAVSFDECQASLGTWIGLGTTCQGIDCLTVGACCLQDGGCVVLSEPACVARPGKFQGIGTACIPVPCPVACCFGGAVCVRLTEAECREQGGTAQPGTFTCSPNPCPGVCCHRNGACAVSTQSECAGFSGDWQPQFSSCTPVNPCLSTEIGACCQEGSAGVLCSVLTQAQCADARGTWMGAGSTCTPNPCNISRACCRTDGTCISTIPTLCPPPNTFYANADCTSPLISCTPPLSGACCRYTGVCVQTTASDCASPDRFFPGVACTSPTVQCPALGACCHRPLTRVTPDAPDQAQCVCVIADELECFNLGGQWFPAPTLCTSVLCQCGACCLPDGSCTVSSQSSCVNQNGAFLGVDVPCGSTTCMRGACCIPGRDCVETVASGCPEADHFFPGIPCSADPCQREGACCFGPEVTGTTWVCLVLSEDRCVLQRGLWLGAGTPCVPFPCDPIGACCKPDGTCELLTQDRCSRFQGALWLGSGTICSMTTCRQTGACCVSAMGTLFCTTLTSTECALSNGSFLGVGSVCTSSTCLTTRARACCFLDGSCAVMGQNLCTRLGGTWLNSQNSCTPNPCQSPTGACCQLDGTCVQTTSSECCGTWLGLGVPCDRGVCDRGACCNFAANLCTVLTRHQCTTIGGNFFGAGTACNGAVCPGMSTGVCCRDGNCSISTQSECQGGSWSGRSSVCSPSACCPSDLDGNHVVDATDLFTFLNSFFSNCP